MRKIALIGLSCCCLVGQAQNNIQQIEYFFNNDPGCGAGIAVPFGPDAFTVTDLSFNADISGLSEGFNMFYVRAYNDSGWSVAAVKPLFVFSAASVATPNISKIEFFVDADPGYGMGVDVSLTPTTTISDLNFTVSLSALSEGFHTLNVRSQNANGKWSPAYVKSIYVLSTSSISIPDITQLEYFIDADPGFGLATQVPITSGALLTDINFAIDLSLLPAGFHNLNVRAKNANGRWSVGYIKPIFVLSSSTTSLPDIIQLEYFFDADPGFGSGVAVPITPTNTLSNIAFTVVTTGLSAGFHMLNVRAKNQNGVWSVAYNKPIFITPSSAQSPIVALEYFFDTDPGVGNGGSITLTPAINIADLVVGANISALTVGPHKLYIRARNAEGVWSTTESYPFEACIQAAPVANAPVGVTFDTFVANWSAALNAVTYQLDISTDTLKTFLPGFNSKTLVVLRDTLSSLPPLTHYQYRVRALGPDNCLSINSDTIYVRTNSTLAIDTDALIALYNATQGSNWTNRSGWLTGLASNSWAGVTVANENVVAVNLPNNNLKGGVPQDLLNVSKLNTLNLAGNEVNAVPDLSGLLDLTSANLNDNKLDFGDLESNLDVTGISYANQKAIGLTLSDTITIGNTVQFSALVGGSVNQYQWRKNDVPITGAAANLYSLDSFSKNDQGTYTCIITSPLIPQLTLTTAPRKLVAVATISGILKVSQNIAASNGTIQLLKITSGGYDSIPITPLPINNDGTFTLEKILLDDYLLVGLADTTIYERALPTYIPNTAYWEEADTISLEENITGLEILSVLEPLNQLTGDGLLFGFVQEDDGADERTEKTKRVGGAGVSARKIEATGKGKEILELIAYVFTNEEGQFSIEGLPPGTYRFNVQYPGYPMDETSFIDFIIGTNALEETVQVEATVINDKITVRELLITTVTENPDAYVNVFPNPGSGVVSIQFEDNNPYRYFTLSDSRGQIVLRQNAREMHSQVDFTTLSSGIYLITIGSQNGISKIVKVMKN